MHFCDDHVPCYIADCDIPSNVSPSQSSQWEIMAYSNANLVMRLSAENEQLAADVERLELELRHRLDHVMALESALLTERMF